MPTANDRGNARKMILKTPRLILRPFAANHLDCMAELMANKDFMRFSMGADDARTSAGFSPQSVRLGPRWCAITIRHHCALERNARWLLRLFSPGSRRQNGNRDRLSTAARFLAPRTRYRGGARRSRSRFPRFEVRARDLVNPSGKPCLAPSGGKKWNDSGKGDDLQRFPDIRFRN